MRRESWIQSPVLICMCRQTRCCDRPLKWRSGTPGRTDKSFSIDDEEKRAGGEEECRRLALVLLMAPEQPSEQWFQCKRSRAS
jgi:hypothetical protein